MSTYLRNVSLALFLGAFAVGSQAQGVTVAEEQSIDKVEKLLGVNLATASRDCRVTPSQSLRFVGKDAKGSVGFMLDSKGRLRTFTETRVLVPRVLDGPAITKEQASEKAFALAAKLGLDGLVLEFARTEGRGEGMSSGTIHRVLLLSKPDGIPSSGNPILDVSFDVRDGRLQEVGAAYDTDYDRSPVTIGEQAAVETARDAASKLGYTGKVQRNGLLWWQKEGEPRNADGVFIYEKAWDVTIWDANNAEFDRYIVSGSTGRILARAVAKSGGRKAKSSPPPTRNAVKVASQVVRRPADANVASGTTEVKPSAGKPKEGQFDHSSWLGVAAVAVLAGGATLAMKMRK